MQGGVLAVVHLAHGADEEGLAVGAHRRGLAAAGAALLGAAAVLVDIEPPVSAERQSPPPAPPSSLPRGEARRLRSKRAGRSSAPQAAHQHASSTCQVSFLFIYSYFSLILILSCLYFTTKKNASSTWYVIYIYIIYLYIYLTHIYILIYYIYVRLYSSFDAFVLIFY